MLDVSIIIVSFNARAHLERCLQSLHDAPPARTHEIIVVDNASTDGSADAARRWPRVRVIEAGANIGFAGGNNVGIRASSGGCLLLLNSDTIVPPGAVDALLAGAGSRSGGRGGRPAARRQRRTRRAFGRPDGRAVERAQAEAADAGSRRAARAAGTVPRLGQRCVPAGAARRRRSCRLARRTIFHVSRRRRLLRRHPRARPAYSVYALGRGHARSRGFGHIGTSPDDARVSPQPARVLRKTPSSLGSPSAAVFEDSPGR